MRAPGLWRRGRLRSLFNLSCPLYFKVPRYRHHISARLDSGGGRGGCTTLRLVLPCFLPVNGVFTTYLQKLIDYGGDVARRLLS